MPSHSEWCELVDDWKAEVNRLNASAIKLERENAELRAAFAKYKEAVHMIGAKSAREDNDG